MQFSSPWFALGGLLSLLVLMSGFVYQPAVSTREIATVPAEVWSAALAKVSAGISDTIHIANFRVTDEHLTELSNIPVRQLHFDQGLITNAGAKQLIAIKSLTAIRLRESPLTDDGLQSIAECVGLDDINLPQANCTDVGLCALARLPKLRYLRFSSPQVTSVGLSELAEIKTLRWLHLIRVPVTKDVLQKLATLPKLESLYVDEAPADNAAWEAFFAARPEVHVHVNQTHHDRDPSRHNH